jgi:cytochrome c biogenesis protein CcmG, thiol:disulfide interchange protein DsbE
MSNRPNTRSRNRPSAAARAAQTADASKRPWWILGVLGLVAGLSIIVALAAASGDSEEVRELPGGTIPGGVTPVPASADATGEVVVTGAALPELPAGATRDAAVGLPAPHLEGTGLDGEELTVPSAGIPTVVAFLAHWCPHCQREVPQLVDWFVEDGLPADVDLVAVATANERTATNFPAGEWLHREAWPVPTMLDDEDNSSGLAYGVSGYPFFVAIDAEGTVVARTSGAIGVAGVRELIDAARR